MSKKKHKIIKRIVLIFLLFIYYVLFPCTVYGEKIKVGIYQNPPKVFLDNKNIPQGIFVDIMNEIARVEKWEIEYIFDTWENNLLALKEGRLDIVLDVSYTKKREEIFTFNRVPILDTWLQVFTTRDKIIDSIDGLRNKRIGVLKGSRQEVYLIEEFPQWVDIPYTLKAYSDYPATINALKSGEIDFLVATRFFYFTLDPSDIIVSTPVIFSPTDVYFAFQKDGENPLIFVIDSHLNLMKNDPHSVYYQSLNRLFSTQERFYIPPSIRIILLIISIGLLFFLGFSILLRKQVKQKTSVLREQHIKLEAAYEQEKLHKAEIERNLAEKELLLKEIHHRVKNNLNIISSLVRIQAKQIHDQREAETVLQNISEQIMVMAIVHNLVYTSGDFEKVDLHAFLEGLLKHLKYQYSFQNITIKKNVEDITLGIDQAIPCGLILGEIVTNALKHAFPERNHKKGILRIDIKKRNSTNVLLQVSDNGIGIRDIESFENESNMGFHIVRLLVTQLNGTLTIKNQKGFLIMIEFPFHKNTHEPS